jgi:hypothetical protein
VTIPVAVVLLLAAAAGPPADDRVAAADVLAHCGCQTELPGVAGDAPADEPTRSSVEWHRDIDAGPRALPPPVAVPGFLPWVLVALAVVLVLGGVLRAWHREPAGPAAAPAASRGGRRDRPVAEGLADPDALACQGRFTEAVHALLLAALAEVVRRSRPAPPTSLTSRELLAAARLPDAARGSLGRLVAVVEPALYGGRRPGLPDYEACAGHYRQFLAAWR